MEGISDSFKEAVWNYKKNTEISSGTFVFKNDLIVAKITPSFENEKQALLYNLPMDCGYATTEVWALNPKNNDCLNSYLYEYLKKENVRRDIAGKMEGSTGRQRVPRRVLGDTMFPKPDIQEQKSIVDIFERLDKKIQSEKNRKYSLEKLFQSLLKKLNDR